MHIGFGDSLGNTAIRTRIRAVSVTSAYTTKITQKLGLVKSPVLNDAGYSVWIDRGQRLQGGQIVKPPKPLETYN